MKTKIYKVYLCNVETVLAHCGYGEGKTREEAIAAALAKAKHRDPDAYYCNQNGCVNFAGGINC